MNHIYSIFSRKTAKISRAQSFVGGGTTTDYPVSNSPSDKTIPALRLLLSAVLVVFVLSCTQGTDNTTATVFVEHTFDSAAVHHVHYNGYNSSGQLIYDLPAMEKSGAYVLSGLPPDVVLIEALFHTADDEEHATNSFSVNLFAGSVLFLTNSCRTTFDPARVALVDENTLHGNLLVRGNFPLSCDNPRSFAFAKLNTRLKQLKGSSFDLNEYEIIIVALINNAGNLEDLKSEEAIFGLNPVSDIHCQNDHGDGTPSLYTCLDNYRAAPYLAKDPSWQPQKFYWWPLWICGADGCTTLDTYSACKLQDLPKHMNDLMNAAPPYTGGKTRRLIYFHCEHGCDRTGTVHAAYAMFKDKDTKLLTLQKAVDLANASISQENNCMKDGYIAMARKYCQYIYSGDPSRCN
jgi:hypothetical protein